MSHALEANDGWVAFGVLYHPGGAWVGFQKRVDGVGVLDGEVLCQPRLRNRRVAVSDPAMKCTGPSTMYDSAGAGLMAPTSVSVLVT